MGPTRWLALPKGRLILVSRFYSDANLYEPPAPKEGKKRGRVKGGKLPPPCQVVENSPRTNWWR